ncbi:probable E3 ubiquitin-protein ligase HERC4 [Antennarius striatus]|uniref:probable E3 ubiquitin-protein ligase HERC4 n=1 Tax=Antennarius striatus TaxID=241820 RepID=UPI0035AE8420
MFSWGEDSRRGFRLKGGSLVDRSADGWLHHLDPGYQIVDLSAVGSWLAFVKSNGNSFIIGTTDSKDGKTVRGQKFVKHTEKIHAVCCSDDAVTLLSERGILLSLNATQSSIPRPVEGLRNVPVSQVSCGSHHSVVLTKDGQVYTWGQDSRGQLGLGKARFSSSSPQRLQSLSAIPLVQVSAGGEQSFALSLSGGVFSWGRNDHGQLGLGDEMDRHTPTSISCLNMKKTVDISCGDDHTVTLTKAGAVFTFGSGQFGQLGHNSFRDELRPRLVAELWGAKVIGIACGRHHTLVLTASSRVYSFGRDEEGQLGQREESHPSVPLPVELPRESADGPKIRKIFAGGNGSFAISSSEQDVCDQSDIAIIDNATQDSLGGLIDKWTSEHDSKSWKKIKKEIHQTFSSASFLNKSFLEQRGDKHFQTSSNYSGLNLTLARTAFKSLVTKDSVLAEVEAAVLHLLPSLDRNPAGLEGLRIHLLLNELLHAVRSHKGQPANTRLAEAAAAAVLRLSADNLQVVGNWWSSLSLPTMVKHVKVWRGALSVILSSKPVPRNSGVKNLLLVLQYMYNVNRRIPEPRIPDSDFCVVVDKQFLYEDLKLWRSKTRRKNVHAEPLILCSFPIVMDLQTKITVFHFNTFETMLEMVQRHFVNLRMEYGSVFPEDGYFVLDLRRVSALEDTFEQLAAASDDDYKRPLVIYFDENYQVDNLYKKDFFHDVFHEIVSPQSGMFMFNDSETLVWFTSKATQDDPRFFQLGILCGLALFNDCIVHFPFPLALFKKLLGVEPSLGDIIEFNPCIGESLLYILEDYTDDDIENLDMYFSISWDGTEVALDPENPDKSVTSQNKKEFVDAYVNHVFNASVQGVFGEFKRGFFQVCDRDLVKLFRPRELQEALVGKEIHDWAKLKENTGYEGSYHVGHPTVQMFWEVFDELNEDQKKAFLWFVTGFERQPIAGMEKIKMTIRMEQVDDLSDDQYYPETHTCFSVLELPQYSTKGIMKTKLVEAISGSRRVNK